MESELFCPRCNLPLKQVRMSNGVFWACDTCGGRAVGLELLRRTFTPESINPLWLHAINGEGKTGCRCPSCAHAMLQVALSENAGVNVDVCRLCHFVWFDMHEVEALVPRPLPSTPAEAPQAAREAIAMAKVQELADPVGPISTVRHLMNSAAELVRLYIVDSISSCRCLGTSRRHQRCIFACTYWRSGRGFCGLAALAESND